jgi:uncharacterized protein (TIGR02266 family)
MTDSVHRSDETTLTAHLRELIKNLSSFVESASEEQKRTVLRLLENQQLLDLLQNWRHGERRKASRKPFSLSVEYATAHEILTDFPRDISSGGMFIETSASLSVGQQITLTFTPPNQKKPIKIAAEVAWTGPGGVGVRFTSSSKALKKMIESL